MQSSLDLTTRLSVETEYKSLYEWSLQEFRADGEKVGGPVIPWPWSLFFRATDFRRIHSTGLADYPEPHIEERDFLKCALQSTGGEFERPVTYSMFGTQRDIGLLTLEVHRLADDSADERCVVAGNIEWEHKEKFSSRSTILPDELSFSVYLRAERYERLLATVSDAADIELTLRISRVSGFYSHWSPDIKTSFVKVLSGQKEQEPELAEGCTINPPALGTVGEFAVTAVRVLRAAPPSA